MSEWVQKTRSKYVPTLFLNGERDMKPEGTRTFQQITFANGIFHLQILEEDGLFSPYFVRMSGPMNRLPDFQTFPTEKEAKAYALTTLREAFVTALGEIDTVLQTES